MGMFGHKFAIVVAMAVAAAGFLAARSACAQVAQGKAPQEGAPYEIIAKGLLGSRLFPVQFRSADLRLEVRNLIVGRGEARAVPTPDRAIMELRGGGVVTTIDGERRERRPGDFWRVEKGSALTLENRADVAVIRAIYILEGAR